MWNAEKQQNLWASFGEIKYLIVSKILLDHKHHFLFYL